MTDSMVYIIISIIFSIFATIAMTVSIFKKSDGWNLAFFILEMFSIIFAIYALIQPHFIVVAY